MMIRLEFSAADPRRIFSAPAAAFRFGPDGVTADPGGHQVARFSGRMWEIDGRHFTRCECRGPARVQLEDTDGQLTEPLGPFDALALYGGSLYHKGALLARFDEAGRVWHAVQSKAVYTAIVIRV